MRFAKFWLRRDADESPHVTEDPEEAQNWRKTGVRVIELQPTLTDEEREAVEAAKELWVEESQDDRVAATLRGLLERTK